MRFIAPNCQLQCHRIFLAMLVTFTSWTCLAEDFRCHPGEIPTLTLNFTRPQMTAISLCTYSSKEMDPMTERSCTWKLRIPRTVHRAQVILEFSFTDRHRELNISTFNVRGIAFAGILSIESSNGTCPVTKPHVWNTSLHFQLLTLRNNTDYVVIELNIDSMEKAIVSDLFQLNVFYSNSSMCSHGLIHHKGRCYAVRETDKMAQAAAIFTTEAGIRDFLKAYMGARSSEIDETSSSQFDHTEMKLAMSYCSASHTLQYWDQDACNCSEVPISSPTRPLPGEGDCVSLDASLSGTGALAFRRVSCTVAMATLLSFPAAPAAARCRGPVALPSRFSAAVIQQRHCARRCRAETKDTGPTPRVSVRQIVVALVAAIVIIAAVSIIIFFRRSLSCSASAPNQPDKSSKPMLKDNVG